MQLKQYPLAKKQGEEIRFSKLSDNYEQSLKIENFLNEHGVNELHSVDLKEGNSEAKIWFDYKGISIKLNPDTMEMKTESGESFSFDS